MNRAVCLIFGLVVLMVSSAAAQQPPTIKDPAEYNAYISALNTQDPTAKAGAMEAFVAQYPNSVVKLDALEQAMAAYQQAGNLSKVLEKAKQILTVEPNSIRALAILTFINRAAAMAGGPNAQAALKEMCDAAQTGLQQLPGWRKPEGTTDADFGKLSAQMAVIFNGAAGFCALQAKDYAKARNYYEKVFQLGSHKLAGCLSARCGRSADGADRRKRSLVLRKGHRYCSTSEPPGSSRHSALLQS